MAQGTPITLDKPRLLRFTIDAVARLEAEEGVGLDELWARKQRIVALVALLYHGLRHEDATLTKARVIKLLDRFVDAGGDTTQLNETVLEALFASGVYGRQLVESVTALRDDKEADGASDPPGPETAGDA